MTFTEFMEMVQKFGMWFAIKAVGLFTIATILPFAAKAAFKHGWPEHYLVRHRLQHANRVLFSVMNDLTKHAFFVTHLNAMNITIPHIAIPDQLRRVVFKDLLIVYTRTFYDNMRKFVLGTNIDDMDAQTFQQVISQMYTDTIAEVESKCLAMGMPQIVIDRFSYWHTDTRETSMSFLYQATSSAFYTSNRVRMMAILDWYTASLQVTLLNAEKTLSALNGELDHVTYKGIMGSRVQQQEVSCQVLQKQA